MFDKKSDYALNKREKDAIVYISATGTVYLTRQDFANEDEFLKWKSWSDGDYQIGEQAGRSFYDNTILLDEKLDVIGAVLSVESEFVYRQAEAECARLCSSLLEQIKSCLTEKQYRRLWLFHVENLTLTAIAAAEGVSEPSVSESISSARKNIFKFLEKHPIKMPVFL
ncbi:MAG: sigma-70 family RNA polymerase sigma factor [Eubacteriales bacterium]|nr:hypothetical protein [Candidatus Saccharimonadaceae bacterium]MDD4422236.1 sigma-70 family RNA polymerase sigma factor [Eubacteriales bacterium]